METCLASSAFGIQRGCLTHLNQSGWGWADRPRALVPGSALPSTSQKGSIDLLALPRMLPKCTSSPNSTSHRLCRSGFQPRFPDNSEQLSNWFTGQAGFVSCQPYQHLRQGPSLDPRSVFTIVSTRRALGSYVMCRLLDPPRRADVTLVGRKRSAAGWNTPASVHSPSKSAPTWYFIFSSHSVAEVCSSLKKQFRDYQQSVRGPYRNETWL